MKDKYKTKKELIEELQGLRQRISNLEVVETKRKQVEDALLDVSLQREEMERIVNRSPAVVFLWRNAPGWPVEYVSDNVRQFGYSPDDFYSGKLPYSDFIHSGDLERVASEVTHNSSRPGKDKFTQKYRVLTNTGGLRWVNDWTWIRRAENGEITHYQGIILDITERKRAEEELRQSEERFRIVVEKSVEAIFLINFDGEIVFWNPAAERLIGLSDKPTRKMTLSDVLTPDSLKIARANIAHTVQTGTTQPSPYELTIRKSDGILVLVELFIGIVDYEGEKHLLGTARDVTERKKVEGALKRSEEKYRDLIENASDAIFTIDRLGRFVNGNKKGEEISGYGREELIGKSFKRLVPGKYMPSIMEIVGKAFRGKIEHGQIEIEIKNKNGHLIPLEITGRPIWGDGKVIAIQCVARDITERKKAEEIQKLQNRIANAALATDDLEQLFKLIHKELGKVMDTSNFFIALYDKENDKISLPYFVDKKDKSGTFPAGKTLTAYIIKNNRPLLVSKGKIDEMIQSGEVVTIGAPSKVWLGVPLQVRQEVIGAIVVQSYEDGIALGEEELEILKFISSQIGLSIECKRAEEALRKSEGKYRDSMEEAPIGICNIDLMGKVTYVNKRFEGVSGYPREEVVGRDGFKLGMFSNETFKLLARRLKARLRGGSPRCIEAQFKCKDGRWIWVEIEARLIKKRGLPVGLQLVAREVTEWKKAEEAQRESEKRYRLLVEEMGEGLAFVDARENITLANPSAEEIFGVATGGLVGRNLSRFMTPKFFKIIKKQTEKRRAGEKSTYEIEIIRADGKECQILITATPRFDEKREYLGADTFFKDVTEQKKFEEELRKSHEQLRSLSAHLQAVREGERTSIAREIHDDLGQTMTALKMDFSLLNRLIPKEEKVLLRKTESMSKLVDMILQDTKRISTELRPGLLDDLGLFAAIEWQAEEFQNRTRIKCEVTLVPENIVLDRDRSTAIFRIFQETLTNIARHANATKVSINLKGKGGKLTLKVGDNGRGITEEQIYDSKSFGLIGIRERVAFLGGEVKIKGVRNKGTTITVSIPFGGAGE